MKAILEYNLPDDTYQHRVAVNSGAVMTDLHRLDEELRGFLRHGSNATIFESTENLAEYVREYLGEHLIFEES